MYALSKNRSHEDPDGGDRPQAPPARIPSVSSSGTTGGAHSPTSASVGAAVARTPKKSYQQEEEYLAPARVSPAVGKAGMRSDGASKVGAVAIQGIGAQDTPSIVSYTTPTYASYDSSGPARGEPQAGTGQQSVSNEDQPIEATRVEDNEADIEAQVQSRMKDQAKDIAQLVHQELVTNMAVPVDVQPSSVGDTSSLSQDQDAGGSASRRNKRICLISVGLLAIIAAVGAGVGVGVSKKPTSGDDDDTVSSEQCSFCFDGSTPPNLTTNLVSEGDQSCAQFLESQTQLESTDPTCVYGQAIAWYSCECPSLPPPPDSACATCENGEVPSTESFEGRSCKDWSTFIAIVGVGQDSSTSCTDLVSTYFEIGCNCGEDTVVDPLSEFKSILEPISGDALENVDSPQYKALNWIANVDSMNLSAEDAPVETIRARYVAAVIYHSFGGDDWSNRHKFMTAGDICTWNENHLDGFEHGIMCDMDKNVETLRLPDNNLDGPIPQELGYYSLLKNINLANNEIEGSLPDALEELTSLQYLNLTENDLTGTLPEYLFTHPELIHLRLDNNTFSGTLSSSLGTSPSLKLFWARDSELFGTIPPSLGQSTVLETVNLHSNKFTGRLPDFMTGSQIWSMWLGDNNLVGTIPTSIGSLSVLERLSISGNDISGTIPSEIGQCLNLHYLWLYNMTLNGAIPSELGTLRFLTYVDLSGNNLGGFLPSEIGNLKLLTDLFLENNGISGTIPTEISGCESLERSFFEYNNFSGDIAPVIDSLPTGLQAFDVASNAINGTIPTSIGLLSLLNWFNVQDNQIRGTIPGEFGSLSELEFLILSFNDFTGTVPSSLANLPHLVRLGVHGNNLSGSLGDEYCLSTYEFLVANTCSDPSQVGCACCTHCCELDTCSRLDT